MERSSDPFDVAIVGGGLAGLTLALQLKRRRPDTSIVVLEKREGLAPEAAFKVGESTVEISADYFARVCGMREHILNDQLEKAGLRFFFPAGDNSDITQRAEWGDRAFAPVPTFQLDRGRFENALADSCREHGIDVRGGARVQDVDLADEHTVTYTQDEHTFSVNARWVVDSAGRKFILKRKLGLEKDVAHSINSAWWRVGNGFVDLEQWGAHDEDWVGRMERPGIRKHSTNHLVGEGYWVWLIPLASESHSIGIVADPRFHPYERISTFDAAMDWLREHEPQLAQAMDERRGDVQDFLKVEDFAHGCTQVYSGTRRWAITGEAGVFLDPLYSPGSDYITIANTFASDLIVRELDGEDVSQLAQNYSDGFIGLFEAVLDSVWNDHYAEFGDAEVFANKVTYDYVAYWGTQAPREYYDKYTDLEFTQSVLQHLGNALRLSGTVQQMFRDWHALGQPENPTGVHAVTSTFPGMWDRLKELKAGLDEETLRDRYRTNVGILEGMAVVYFHKACRRLPDGPPDPEQRIDPYAVSVHPERWEADGLFSDDGLTLAEAYDRAPGLRNMLLDELAMATA